MLHDVTPHIADCDLAVLGHTPDDLHEILAPLLGQCRDREADELAVVRGREPQVGLLDGALDPFQRTRVERLNDEQARLWRGDRGEALERRRRAVVVRRDAVEKRGRRPAGADRASVEGYRAARHL